MSLPPSDGLSRHLDTLPRHRRYRHRVIAIYIVSLCVMLVLFGWLLKGQYEQELQAAEARAAARASVVAEWANGVLGQSAQALFGLEELLERQTAGVPDREVQVQVALENLTRYLPLIDELGVLNADGRAWVSSGDNRHAGRDLSQTARCEVSASQRMTKWSRRFIGRPWISASICTMCGGQALPRGR
ncbi:PDC sensor domain-containing protein [Vreelandella hamiltonii]|uniref:Uncharacterized protein n=1 Tax=Halomonas johnsoniae TaxID=502832 RepID=A0ABQ2WHU6_9GAMM|nr:hypothetical protein [Halomonas johnsoniae]GGW57100.1 hypothetical protein GCM10007158_17780 [Halomonas johnsoniae]